MIYKHDESGTWILIPQWLEKVLVILYYVFFFAIIGVLVFALYLIHCYLGNRGI